MLFITSNSGVTPQVRAQRLMFASLHIWTGTTLEFDMDG